MSIIFKHSRSLDLSDPAGDKKVLCNEVILNRDVSIRQNDSK